MMIINILGIALIGLIIWWFWLYKPSAPVEIKQGNIRVIVSDGVYQPSRIKVVAGLETNIEFYRQDGSPCASTVIFPDFEVSEELPLNENKTVKLPKMVAGEYDFHCPMKMYKGSLIVESKH
jgi:plastocyanin domain-containing protein